jgi:hypothetical protein
VNRAILDGDASSRLRSTNTVNKSALRNQIQNELLSFKPAAGLRDPATGQTRADRLHAEIKSVSPQHLRPTGGPKANASEVRGSMQKELLRFDPAKLRDSSSGVSARAQLNSEIERVAARRTRSHSVAGGNVVGLSPVTASEQRRALLFELTKATAHGGWDPDCLPSTVCPQLFALNCLPSTVCPQLFALNCSPSTNTPLLPQKVACP